MTTKKPVALALQGGGMHGAFTWGVLDRLLEDVCAEAVLASACVPTLFQAITIDGQHYWDGGYMGNPAIFPLIYHCGCC